MHREGLGAGLLFFALALLFHWHSVLHPLTSVGSLTDELLLSWTLDWNAKWFAHPQGSIFDTPFFAPFPRTLAYTEHVIGLSLLAWPVTALSDTPLLSYNLLLILSTWLTGWCTWLLARSLGAGWTGAVVAGIVAALAPTRLMHSPGHVNILSQWWIPLSLYALHCYCTRTDRRFLLLLGACVVGQGLVSPQGLLLQIVALIIVVGISMQCVNAQGRRRYIHAALTLATALIALYPVWAPYVGLMHDPGVLRPQWHRALFAPSLSELLLPQWSFFFTDFERTVAVGVTPLIVLAGGYYALSRATQHVPGARIAARSVFPYFVLMLAGALLAMGPAMTLWRGGASIPGVYELVGYLPGFSGIRAVGRFSLLMLLGIAVSVGLSWDSLIAWAGAHRRWVSVTLIALLLAEFAITLPKPFQADATSLSARPVDAWLRALPQGCIIAEVPFEDYRTGEGETALFIYHIRYHGKRIVNGYAGAAPAGYFRLERELIEGSADAGIDGLKGWGADYLAVHPSLFTDARAKIFLEALARRDDSQEVARFPDVLVFRIQAPHATCL
jgi:hypothetical protein